MRGMRRNSLTLSAPTPKGEQDDLSIRGLQVLGVVVNPRNHVPLISLTDGEYVSIRSLHERQMFFKHGSGYYDTTHHGKSEAAEEFSNLPRSHTPGGVLPLGLGYGTSLYTALSLGAYLVNQGDAEIKMNTEGEGICSESEGRSRDADEWWNAALEKGLTERDSTEETETEESVDLDADASDLESCVSLDEGKSITYVNTVNVDIETTVSFTVDSYHYKEAWARALVCLELQDPDYTGGTSVPKDIRRGTELKWLVEHALSKPGIFKDTSQVALLAIDVRGLDVQAVNLLALAYMASGLGDKEVDALYYRWKHDLDPAHEIRQLRMFSPNARAAGMSDVIEARKQANWAALENLP